MYFNINRNTKIRIYLLVKGVDHGDLYNKLYYACILIGFYFNDLLEDRRTDDVIN